MAVVFEEASDGVVYLEPDLADRKSGGLVRWLESGGIYRPSGHTWNRESAASMTFTFTVDTTASYEFYVRGSALQPNTGYWATFDGQERGLDSSQYGPYQFMGSDLQWRQYAYVPLTAGKHTLTIHSVHENFEVAKFAIQKFGLDVIDPLQFTDGGGQAMYTGSVMPSDPYLPDNYIDWLDDESRNPHRVLLLEMTHDGGAVRFASQPFLSNKNLAYDDGMVSNPYTEESIGSGRQLGDVEVHTEDDDIDLNTIEFRGYPAKWSYGDVRWNIEDFRTISTTTTEQCKLLGVNHFQFDYVPPTEIYKKTFHVGEDVTYDTHVILDAVLSLLNQFEGAPAVRFLNIDATLLAQFVKYTVTESSTLDEMLTLVANTVDGFYRTTQEGLLELARIDRDHNPAVHFDKENIINNSVTVSEIIPPKKRVRVNYNNGEDSVTVDTEADTGSFDDELVVDCMFSQLVNAEELANTLADRYRQKQVLYTMSVVDLMNVVTIGEFCTINSNSLNTTGVVYSIKRTPLSAATEIEVLV